MDRWLDRINWVIALLFGISAILQYNDPDPARWIALYGAAGLACLLARWRVAPWVLPAAIVGTAALVWSAVLAPRALRDLQLVELFGAMSSKTPEIELGREFLGLLMIASWMLVLVVAHRRRRLTLRPTDRT
jgi:hypothetical protein